jgi:hypothetical protein
MVDHSALKTNQLGIVATVIVAVGASAFFWPAVWLIPALALVLLLGTGRGDLALFKQLYFRVLKPRGLVRPRPVNESPAPHNFAQGLGGVFLVLASVLLPFTPVAGLALAVLVAILAFVNLAFGFCLGCQIYFLIGRRRQPAS